MLCNTQDVACSCSTQDVVRCFLTSNIDTLVPTSLPLLPPQQFGIWLDSSSPEQTVPYLWSEESPASKPHEASPVVFILDQSVRLGFAG